MKIDVSRRARREIERINRWWVKNRDAKELFLQELSEAEAQLKAAPEGETWRRRGKVVIRRCLLPKTGYHLYYRYDASSEHLLVVAVWGAKRGSEPAL